MKLIRFCKGRFDRRNCVRQLACVGVLLISASHQLLAQQVDDDGSYRMYLTTGVGRFSGDYGRPEETTLDVFNVTGRWYFARGEVQVSLPYISLDGEADVRFVDGRPVTVPGESGGGGRSKESGLGDTVVRGEYYLRTGTSTSPWVIGVARLKLPTGNENRGLGTGATDVELGVDLIQRHGALNWLFDAGYTLVGNSLGSKPRNVLRLGGGVSVPFGIDERSSGYVYLENRTNRYKNTDDQRSLAVGVSTSLDDAKRLRVSGSLFFGLSDSTEDLGVYLTVGRRY